MAYARLRTAKVWHKVLTSNTALCNAPLSSSGTLFTKSLRDGERLCSNCAGLMGKDAADAYQPKA